MGLSHLTNKEVAAQLTLRDDLTELEQDLLDRLIRSTEEVERLERAVILQQRDSDFVSVIP